MNITAILRSNRSCRALTGLNIQEFHALVPTFRQALIARRYELRPDRKRKVGGGQKGVLRTDELKLAFILTYLKVYPTFDVMAVLTLKTPSECCEGVHLMLSALERALKKVLVLPKRKVRSVEEFFEVCPEAKDVFLDGTERRVQKPRSLKKRNKLYSGKRKATTRKNVVLTDEKKKILVLTPTKSGRRHDKRIADKVSLANHIPDEVALWTDTGFQSMQRIHPNTIMPHKATKNHPLTREQKQENRVIAGIRVLSEHAIAGMKRLKAASDIYRNRLPNLDDAFMLLAAGIWNFHLQQT
jgi:hypothetical protein